MTRASTTNPAARPPRTWLSWVMALAILLTGGAATMAGWHWFNAENARDAQRALQARAQGGQGRATGFLALTGENLIAMAELLRAGEQAQSPVYQRLVRNLMRQHPEIAGIGWVPKAGTERLTQPCPEPAPPSEPADPATESAAATVADCDPTATVASTAHAPLRVLITNPDGPGAALDVSSLIDDDLGEELLLRSIIDQTASAPGIAYQGPLPGFWWVFFPIEGESGLRGHMLALIASELLLENVVKGNPGDGLARKLTDPSGAGGDPVLLYQEGAGTPVDTLEVPVSAFGRSWTLEVGALPEFMSQQQTRLPQYVLLGGGALTLLLTSFVFTVLSRSARIRQLVNRRTAELSEAYQRVRDSEMMAMQSEKMSSLGQMVAGVAHEINTPLGFISSNVQLMRELLGRIRPMLENLYKLMAAVPHWTKLTPEQKQLWFKAALQQSTGLAQIRQEGISEDLDSLTSESLAGLERLTDLVLTLKNFSRLDRSLVDDVDLNVCIEDTLKIAHNVIKQKAEVSTKLSPLPKIRVNPSQFNQVLLNLITNAAHAIPRFGLIELESRVDGPMIKVAVRDNGSGIPPEVLSRIFEPFFTTKGHGEGTGLGLAISRRIVEEHGGQLDVESHVGVGTVFTISIPVN